MDSRKVRFIKEGIERSRTDPVWFANNILKIDLDPWQEELLESLGDVWRYRNDLPTKYNHEGRNKITVRAMHGPGKTFGAALAAHWFGFCFRGKIPCTAPKERQLLTRLWPEFRKIRRMAPPEYRMLMDVQTSRVTWCGDPDWMMIAETASTPENLAGYHDEYLLFICEEASGIPEEMFPVIQGALSVGRMVAMVMIGNPTTNVGTFYQSHMTQNVAKHYYQMHVSLDKTNRPGLKEWVKEMEEQYGKDSPVVAVRCYGNFAELDENQLLSLTWIVRATDKADPFKEIEHSPKIRVTADVADGGQDSTVITVAKHYQQHVHVLLQREFNFPPAESPIMAADKCIELFYLYGGRIEAGDDMVIDALGVGAGTAGYLIKEGHNVVEYRGGESSDDKTKWRNRRTQSYMSLRNAFRDMSITFDERAIDSFDHFAAQLCSIRTRPGIERVEDLETRQSMKDRGIKSPDRADSLAMQYATQYPTMGGGSFAPVETFGTMETANEAWSHQY